MGLTLAILLRVGAISMSAVGLFVGGTVAIVIAIAMAIGCVMMKHPPKAPNPNYTKYLDT